MATSNLFDLPAELRIKIFEYHADAALVTFANDFKLPALFHSCQRIRNEYGDVFFADERIMVLEFHSISGTWAALKGMAAKMAVFQHPNCALSDLFDRSLASAQRYVQRNGSCRSGVRNGILTLSISWVPRWWQWTITADQFGVDHQSWESV